MPFSMMKKTSPRIFAGVFFWDLEIWQPMMGQETKTLTFLYISSLV